MSGTYIGEWASKDKSGRPLYTLPINDRYYVEIGRIAAHVAGIEYEIQKLLWKVLNIDPATGRALTVATRTDTQIECILVAIKSNNEIPEKDKISSFIDRVKRMRTIRNEVVHALWVADIENDRTIPASMKLARNAAKENSRTRYTVEDLSSISNDAHQLYSELCLFASGE